MELAADSFGRLLRSYRTSVGLTQEALAERAGLSRRGIADLERGARRSPHRHTIEQLAQSLGLAQHERAVLVAAARRRLPGDAVPQPLLCLAEPPAKLVGRTRELSELVECLRAAGAGRGRLALVSGEAGIGKSALVSAFARQAVQRDAAVLAGHAYELTDTPPYGPWLEVVRGWHRDNNAPLAPAVLGGLEELAARRPIVVVLEDLQWADPASLDVLRVVARGARQLPLVVVGTYRDEELGRENLLQAHLPLLVHEADPLRLTLKPLEREAVSALVRQRYSLPVAETTRVVEYLQRHGEGNPFYIGELLRALEEIESLRRTAHGWRVDELAMVQVPRLVRQLVEQRVARLGSNVRGVLDVAAVIGEDVPLALLVSVSGGPQEAVLDAVERAVGAGLVQEASDGLTVGFAHAIIRSALYESLLAARRRVWHARVAAVLLGETEPDPDAVAYHLRQAGDEGAADWLVRASQRAERAFALVTAADRLALAIPLLEARGLSAAERGWLHFKVAQLRRWSEPAHGIVELDVAERLARESGDQVLAAHAVVDRGWLRCTVGDLELSIAELSAGGAALEALPREDGALAGTGVVGFMHRPSTLVWVLASVGRLRDAMALGQRYISQAEEPWLARMACVGNAGSGLVCALSYLGRPAAAKRALHQALDAYAQIEHAGTYIVRAWMGGFHVLNLLVLPYATDERDAWEPMLAEAERLWSRAGAGALEAQRNMLRMPLHYIDGEWDRLRELATLARSPGMVFLWTATATGLLCQLALNQGAYDEVQQLVGEAFPAGPETEPGGVFLQTALTLQRAAATVALETRDHPIAARWLSAHDRWVTWSGTVMGQAEGELAWAAYHRAAGDLMAAGKRAASALERAREPRQPLNLLGAHRLLAELAIQAGRQNEAGPHLEQAARLADACRAPYEHALVQLVQAEQAHCQDRPDAVRWLLGAAHECFSRLGARPALGRVRSVASRRAHQ